MSEQLTNNTKPDCASRVIKSCEKCICSRCSDNIVNGNQSASCSGCATCSGIINDCPFDLFQEG